MYHFIINPTSRSGKTKKIWEETIEPTLKNGNIDYRVHFSEASGSMGTLAGKVAAKYPEDHIILLGGDGTINEVLQGIKPGSDTVIGYIPTGSGNDLAKDLHLSKNPKANLVRILRAGEGELNYHRMDRGIANMEEDSYSFAVSCGIGFDAAVCEEVMRSRLKDTLNKVGLGKLIYLAIALKQLFTAKRTACRLYLDDRPPIYIKNIFFIAAMIHKYEGGGFKFGPTADDADGIFELCVVGNIPKLLVLLALPTGYFGKQFLFPGVNHYSARRIRIETDTPLWVHTDGEVHRRSDNLLIECRAQDLRFII